MTDTAPEPYLEGLPADLVEEFRTRIATTLSVHGDPRTWVASSSHDTEYVAGSLERLNAGYAAIRNSTENDLVFSILQCAVMFDALVASGEVTPVTCPGGDA